MLLTGRKVRLESLELQCVEPTTQQISDKTNWTDLDPLRSVDFSCLQRLRIFGNTSHMPVTDSDVVAIASTATGLREFHLTCNSSTTIDSVVAVAVAEAAPTTLRILQYSSLSRDGFWHSHPGSPNGGGQHYCAMFRKLPKLETLSVSLPSICADFFSNELGRFSGTIQIRAVHLCEYASSRWTSGTVEALQSLLDQAGLLIKRCSRDVKQDRLYVEFFFAGYVFEPGLQAVHGDFSMLRKLSGDRWSPDAASSSKGPYGCTGANEAVSFERIDKRDFLHANQWLCAL